MSSSLRFKITFYPRQLDLPSFSAYSFSDTNEAIEASFKSACPEGCWMKSQGDGIITNQFDMPYTYKIEPYLQVQGRYFKLGEEVQLEE